MAAPFRSGTVRRVNPQNGSRDAWLDGLRAVAALMVFFHHATPGTYLGGWDAGLMVFFALSGYLLYRPFVAGPVDLRKYAIRRLLRIYPAYLVAAVGIALLHDYPFEPVGVLTMSNTPVIVAWTLQIEVVFYATLPLLALVARNRRPALLAVAALSLAIGAVSLATTRVFPGGFPAWAWAFVPGMIVAQIAQLRPAALARATHPLVPTVGLVLLAMSIVPDIRYPDVAAAVGSAVLIAWILTRPAPGRRLASVLIAGGALSYSFYLWHEALMMVDRPPSPIGVVLALLLSGFVAAAVYLVVERPAIRLARRLTTDAQRSPSLPLAEGPQATT